MVNERETKIKCKIKHIYMSQMFEESSILKIQALRIAGERQLIVLGRSLKAPW